MRQKGFATIFGLCLILVFALIMKGIQEAETNHAREVLNFQMEQALQSAAESGIIEAVKYVQAHPNHLPYVPEKICNVVKEVPVKNKTFHQGDKKTDIEVEVRGERGEIYLCPPKKDEVHSSDAHVGVYLMSRATIRDGVLGEDNYRRAYAYILDGDTRIYFMELPTLPTSPPGKKYYVTKK